MAFSNKAISKMLASSILRKGHVYNHFLVHNRRCLSQLTLSKQTPNSLLSSKSILVRQFSSSDSLLELSMPALSPTMETGTLVRWRYKEGDALAPGDVLCEVETDKATVDYEMQDDAVLAKIIVAEGTQDIPVGTLLAYTVEDVDAFNEFVKNGSLIPESKDDDQSQNKPAEQTVAPIEEKTKSHSSRVPLIKFLGKRSLLKKNDIVKKTATPSAVKVVKEDTQILPEIVASSSESQLDYSDIQLTTMRKVIAKRLAESKQTVPHSYSSIDCEIDNIMKIRRNFKSVHGINISVNDFILKAVACALREVPQANFSLNAKTGKLEKNDTVDISVAVATDAGLITPIVTDVNSKGLGSINEDFKELVSRARGNKLKPEEFQGGSFTVSNLGGFGISNFTAVINPPQACILAVGGGRKTVVAPKLDIDNDETDIPPPRVATLMNVSLSSDRRVVDDAVAGEFLQAFKNFMENPELLMI